MVVVRESSDEAPIAIFGNGDGDYNIHIGKHLIITLSEEQTESLYDQLLSEFAMRSCDGR